MEITAVNAITFVVALVGVVGVMISAWRRRWSRHQLSVSIAMFIALAALSVGGAFPSMPGASVAAFAIFSVSLVYFARDLRRRRLEREEAIRLIPEGERTEGQDAKVIRAARVNDLQTQIGSARRRSVRLASVSLLMMLALGLVTGELLMGALTGIVTAAAIGVFGAYVQGPSGTSESASDADEGELADRDQLTLGKRTDVGP